MPIGGISLLTMFSAATVPANRITADGGLPGDGTLPASPSESAARKAGTGLRDLPLLGALNIGWRGHRILRYRAIKASAPVRICSDPSASKQGSTSALVAALSPSSRWREVRSRRTRRSSHSRQGRAPHSEQAGVCVPHSAHIPQAGHPKPPQAVQHRTSHLSHPKSSQTGHL